MSASFILFFQHIFRTAMANGNNLKFPTRLSGNSNGYFDGEKFSAPITGRYRIGLYLDIYGGGGGHYYWVQMKQSGSSIYTSIHDLVASGSSRAYDYRHFAVEVELQKNENIYFYILGHSSGIHYNSFSFMEGRLIHVQ